MSNALERWKSGDKRLQVVAEGFSEEHRKFVIDLFEQLGWGVSERYLELFLVSKVLANTYIGYPTPCGKLLRGPVPEDRYPVTTVKDLSEIVDYENSKKQENVNVSESNTFTKQGLISGDHIVELRNGERYLVAGDLLISSDGYFTNNRFHIDLSHCGEYECYGIIKLKGKFYKAEWCYYSYDGVDYDDIGDTIVEVEPKEVVVTKYYPVK